MALSNKWEGDWDEIGVDHMFNDFRSMVCHVYYRHNETLERLLYLIHRTHKEPTMKNLRDWFKDANLPLKDEDKEVIS